MRVQLHKEREAISDAIGRTVMKNIKAMAQMGMQMEQYVMHLHPGFPIQRGKRSWEDYLPPLSTSLQDLMNKYGGNMQQQKRKTLEQPLKQCWERER